MYRKLDKSITYKDDVYDPETGNYIQMAGEIVGILDEKYKVLNEFEKENKKTENC